MVSAMQAGQDVVLITTGAGIAGMEERRQSCVHLSFEQPQSTRIAAVTRI